MTAQHIEVIGKIAYKSLVSLIGEDGLQASGKNEIYGCTFGRDSAITVLKILHTVTTSNFLQIENRQILLDACRKTLLTLVSLQGQVVNIESGEEPGKFVHEYRKENFSHLLKLDKPWYVYPDGKLRNYDSLDSTPLALLAIHKYWELIQDQSFLDIVLPAVEKGLEWMLTYADKDGDHLVEYELPQERVHGGLPVQSWTDSHESLLRPDGTLPLYPIAPVEVQGYTWHALRVWAHFYLNTPTINHSRKISRQLREKALRMKHAFNDRFIFKDKTGGDLFFVAQALDGRKQRIETVTGNPLLLLWASYASKGKRYSIVDRKYIPDIVKRSFLPDMFDKDAGLRTMSTLSKTFNPKQNSYHNGSFWPKLNGMAHRGLLAWGYRREARKLAHATLKPLLFFGTPIELYIKTENGEYVEYRNEGGQVSCREQAWSAACALDITNHYFKNH